MGEGFEQLTTPLVYAGLAALVVCGIAVAAGRKLMWRNALIVATLCICAGYLAKGMRLGPDLAGGVSLTYQVQIDSDQNQEQVLQDVIEVQKRRIDPKGLLNLNWRTEQGGRIVIEMPLPSARVLELRDAFDQSIEAFESSAVSVSQVVDAIENSGSFSDLTGEGRKGVDPAFAAQRKKLLNTAAKAFQSRIDAKRQAEALEGGAPNSEKQKQYVEALDNANKAGDAYNKAIADFMATSIDARQLRRILDLSSKDKKDDARKLVAGTSPRAVELEKLYAQYPSRKQQIMDVVGTRDAYYAEKGPLDDPEDLKRLIQGAGVLAFRIVVQPRYNHPNLDGPDMIDQGRIDALRAKFKKEGPKGASDGQLGLKWFEIDQPQNTVKDAVKSRVGINTEAGTVLTRKFAMVFVALGVFCLVGFILARKSGNANAAMTFGLVCVVMAIGALVAWSVLPADDEMAEAGTDQLLAAGELTTKYQKQMEEDPAAFFQLHEGMIVEAYNGRYYTLLHDLPAKSITHDRTDQQPWALARATRSQDQFGRAAIGFEMDAYGRTLMGELTGNNRGRRMAIVLDDRLVSAPAIQAQIFGNGIITGSFSKTEVNYLIRTLNAGSLAGKMSSEPIEERVFQPRMGAENLRQGLESGIWAIIGVAVFMMLYYFASGAIANAALAANVVIILGVLTLYNATFTLPGIAGIVLTIGMCVDANVLILERVREELRRGIEPEAALRLGYEKALSSIIDGNMTNLIVCFILGYTATAAIKGFAITLGIGICATLFTALFMTRTIYMVWMKYGSPHLGMLPLKVPAIEKALHPEIDWIGKRYLFFGASAVVLVVSLTLAMSRGADLFDIEFRAGTEAAFTLKKDKPLTQAQVVGRLTMVSGWFVEGFDASTLNETDKAKYDVIQAGVAKARLAALQQAIKRETGKTAPPDANEQKLLDSIEDEALRKALVEEVDRAVDLSQLAAPTIVGLETLSGKGPSFSLLTPVNGADAVGAVIRAAFEDELSIKQALKFKGQGSKFAKAPYYAITDRSLNTVTGRTLAGSSADNVAEYIGGVAIILEEINPPSTIEDIHGRIRLMRQQPDYDAFKYRKWKVVGLKQGEGKTYSTAVVLIQDEAQSAFENRELWESQVAATEWSLINDGLSRTTSLDKISNFTPTIAQTLKNNAIKALVFGFIAIVGYIWLRFGSLRYGLAAFAALVHDVVVAIGAVALCGYVFDIAGPVMMIGPFKIDMAMIAAVLTIIGYSLNDTIVLFDRVRENRGRLAVATTQILNDSINQVISRTVLTSLTTFMAVFMMYLFGGPGIHGFAFALVVGVVAGTYSSIAIASPLLMIGMKAAESKAKAAAEAEAAAQGDSGEPTSG